VALNNALQHRCGFASTEQFGKLFVCIATQFYCKLTTYKLPLNLTLIPLFALNGYQVSAKSGYLIFCVHWQKNDMNVNHEFFSVISGHNEIIVAPLMECLSLVEVGNKRVA